MHLYVGLGWLGLGVLMFLYSPAFLGLQNTNNEIVDPVKLRIVIMKRNRLMGINVGKMAHYHQFWKYLGPKHCLGNN